jgi:NAD(P)-dependent dehydrogenase (short-subunit alcohol dehydrogenase family)
MKPFSLKNSAALVTGSSKGIGFAIAQGLGEAGADVVYHGTCPRSGEIPPESPYITGDLRGGTAPYDLIRAAMIRLPHLNLLVCNAGSFFDVPFLEMTPPRWKHTMQLNLTANYFLIQEFAKRLIQEERGGSVVIISGTTGTHPEPDSSAYDISKAGLVMMTKTLAVALADHGIRVNGVAPGAIKTQLTSERMRMRPQLPDQYDNRILLGRLGNPEDIAGAVVFLCSPAAQYITGEIITVDGGMTLSQVGKV